MDTMEFHKMVLATEPIFVRAKLQLFSSGAAGENPSVETMLV